MTDDRYFNPLVTEHLLTKQMPEVKSYTWTHPVIQPFDELLLSWNAQRPSKGHYVILVSLLHRLWSPWLLYAVWGSQEQYSFHDTTSESPVRTFQDQVEMLDKQQASGFRIRVEACEGANLDPFISLFACTSSIHAPKKQVSPVRASYALPVKGISQFCLTHPRATSLCSPTSATAVIHYLSGSSKLSPMKFAQNVYDAGFDIYGNWPFSAAQSYVELGPHWRSYCARLAGFDKVLSLVNQGFPVTVSVKGPLSGSLTPYSSGHLLVVTGYQAQTESVLCMDPAYSSDEKTSVAYPLQEFIHAWEKRHNLAYVIMRNF